MENKYWRDDIQTSKGCARFHLVTTSTVLLLTGLFLWLNTIEYKVPASMGSNIITGTCPGQGFPFNFRPHVFGGFTINPNPVAIFFNLVAGLAIIGAIALVIEWYIRRKNNCKKLAKKKEGARKFGDRL